MKWFHLLYLLSISWIIVFIMLLLITGSGDDGIFGLFLADRANGKSNSIPMILVSLNVILGMIFIGVGADMLTTSKVYDLKC